ncbi:MAG: metal dependent phosphohydrolase [Solirubrobacterales bacterium]|nr:metal dependent phosphohydrolase [Solirubrobacterales bacterium]
MPILAPSLARREGGSREPPADSPEQGDRARQPIVPLATRAADRPRFNDTPRVADVAEPPRDDQPREAVVPWTESSTGLIRYLPVALFVTLTVALAPALIADALVAPRGLAGTIVTLACAVAISLALAALESAAWKRLHRLRGVVFSDLMLWNFARRLWAERRLERIGAVYARAVAGDGEQRVELLEGLSRLLETRNPQTYGHCRRVARHAEQIARTMRLTPTEIAEVRAAALIHDVGKVYTPPAILQKRGPLTDEEFDLVKRHCADGAEMLAPVRDRRLADVVLHHHERIDGSGYPDGLVGEEIPLAARIIAVADTFDAITSDRSYRNARSQRDGLAVLESSSGKQLDATAVAAFLDVYAPRRGLASVSLSAAAWARLAPLQLLPGGGASLAGLVPAVGAAGLLAVAPAARYEKSAAERDASSQRSSLQAQLPGGFAATRPAARPGSRTHPTVTLGSPGARRLGSRLSRPAPGPVASSRAPRAPQGTGAPSGATGRSGEAPALAVGPAEVVVPSPPAPTPTANVVPPPSSTGSVTVAPLSTPVVAAGPVQVPSVTVPGVVVVPPPPGPGG